RSALDTSLADLVASAHSMALELSDHSHAGQVTLLARLREQRQMTEALIVTSSGRIIASSGGSLGQLVPELPTGTMLQQARVRRAYQAELAMMRPLLVTIRASVIWRCSRR